MIESKTPCHIVNTSSINGLYFSTMVPYDATKHAITSLSETLFLELRETNIGVSVLCPGWVKTDLAKTTEKLGKQQSELSVLTPEILKSFNLDRETLDNLFDSGMEPDMVAELVIKAIQEDIFYIITNPESMQLVQNRFDKIVEDSRKLHE
jgi:short-subunit dehydrogenase